LRARLGEVDAVLIGAAAVGALALPLDASHGARRVGIAGLPDAGRALVPAEEQGPHVLKEIKPEALQLALEPREAPERLEVLLDREGVLAADQLVVHLKDVEPGRGHAEAFDIAQPVVHPVKLIARGLAAVP